MVASSSSLAVALATTSWLVAVVSSVFPSVVSSVVSSVSSSVVSSVLSSVVSEDVSSLGPWTMADGLLVNCLGLSSLVQTAPAVVQDRLPGRVMTTSLVPVGFDGDLPEVASSADPPGPGDVAFRDAEGIVAQVHVADAHILAEEDPEGEGCWTRRGCRAGPGTRPSGALASPRRGRWPRWSGISLVALVVGRRSTLYLDGLSPSSLAVRV